MFKLLFEYGADHDLWQEGTQKFNLLPIFNFESILRDKEAGKLGEVIAFFLQINADIDAKDDNNDSLLLKLCKNEANMPIIEKLVEIGARIDCEPLLIQACRSGCLNIVRFLLRNGANTCDVDKIGRNCY